MTNQSGQQLASAVEEWLGEDYQISHGLGAGSGGQVYKAIQRTTGQAVAVKVLSLDCFDESVRARRLERFRREIEICSGLYHPDIVRLLDSGETANTLQFAVFEFIPGVTLAELLREEGALTVARARDLMLQLLSPLAYAHSRGIAHRDLKPSNIMVIKDGERDRVKVLDFGISVATAALEDERLTLSHEWVGTPGYAAPEQLRGESTSAKSDLYAWGLVFVECLTGAPVVTGRILPEILEQQLSADPLELPEALRGHRLGSLLGRVLEKDPTRRPGDAEMLRTSLVGISTEHLEDAHGYLPGVLSQPNSGQRPRFTHETQVDGRDAGAVDRRHATVLCVNVCAPSGGTSYQIASLDESLDDADSLVQEIVGQFGASVSHSVGGCTLAYFGLLQTRAEDGRLAMRAALELVSRLGSMPGWTAETRPRVQIGIHYGPVTLRLSGTRRRPINGVTPRRALELALLPPSEDASEASVILATGDYQQTVARHAEFESTELRGMTTGANAVYRLVGESRASTLRSRPAVFVGRDTEFSLLESEWRESRAGKGRSILIVGEAGIGKSRIAAELMSSIAQHGPEWLEVRCLPEWENAFLRPLATLFAEKLGFGQDVPPETLLQSSAQLGLDPATGIPLICAWLSLPMPTGYAPLPWSPPKQRQLLHECVADALIHYMAQGGGLLVEDLHWADPSTLDCLDVLATRSRQQQAFILMTSRPGKSYHWSTEPQELVLPGLDREALSELARALVPPGPGENAALAHILERSDGIPLYVEELAIACRSNLGSAPTSTHVAGDSTRLSMIPTSLRDLLTSRLDEVELAQQTAQFAAALGREFSLEMLTKLSEKDEFALLADLEQLTGSELLVKRLRLGSTSYLFRHALIRDAAYDSMQADAKRKVHLHIAAGVEQHFPELPREQPDVLAFHWECAGDPSKAVDYWKQAAQRSNMASAHDEALAQLERALQLLPATSSGETDAARAVLLLTRGATLIGKRGFGHPDVGEAFQTVASLVPVETGIPQLAFAARWGLWYFRNCRAELLEAQALAEELETIAERASDRDLHVSASEASCETAFCMGRHHDSIAAGRRCEALYDFDRHRHLAASRGDDPLLASLSFEAMAQLTVGHHAIAIEQVEQALALAERLGYPSLTAGMHAQAAWVYLIRGSSGATEPDLAAARQHTARAMVLASEHGFPFWQVYALMIDAAARIAGGDTSALAELQQGANAWLGAGAGLGRSWHLAFIGQAQRLDGKHADALCTFDEALQFCGRTQERYFEPEIRRQRALVLLDATNPARDQDAALHELTLAGERANAMDAKWWSLAITLTTIRHRAPELPGDLTGLDQLLQQLGPVPRDDLPPLVREAIELLKQ